MHCQQCGHGFSEQPPKFCPQCGAPTATAPPSTAATPAAQSWAPQFDAQQARAAAVSTWAANKTTWIALGLWFLGFLLGAGAAIDLVGILWFGVFPLVILDAINPAFYAGVPSWLRRPTLGAAVSLVAILSVVVPAGFSLGWFALAGGTWKFVKDSLARGETLGPLDLRLLWVGWRRWLVIGILLASFTYAAPWEPYTYVTGYTYTTRSGGWEYTYRTPGSSYGQGSAMAIGAEGFPALLTTGALVWAMWRGTAGVPGWFRFVPLAMSPLLIFHGIRHGQSPDWVEQYKGIAYGSAGGGSLLFILMLLPFFVAAVQFARGKN